VGLAAAALVLANVADVDVIPGLVMHGHPGLYHHQATHSLLAVLLLSPFLLFSWYFMKQSSYQHQ
jgi:hypothetical protein